MWLSKLICRRRVWAAGLHIVSVHIQLLLVTHRSAGYADKAPVRTFLLPRYVALLQLDCDTDYFTEKHLVKIVNKSFK